MKHTRKARVRTWVLIAADIVVAGALLLVFALFDHVLPQSSEVSGETLFDPSSSVGSSGELG